jgi:hypothetical protein
VTLEHKGQSVNRVILVFKAQMVHRGHKASKVILERKAQMVSKAQMVLKDCRVLLGRRDQRAPRVQMVHRDHREMIQGLDHLAHPTMLWEGTIPPPRVEHPFKYPFQLHLLQIF